MVRSRKEYDMKKLMTILMMLMVAIGAFAANEDNSLIKTDWITVEGTTAKVQLVSPPIETVKGQWGTLDSILFLVPAADTCTVTITHNYLGAFRTFKTCYLTNATAVSVVADVACALDVFDDLKFSYVKTGAVTNRWQSLLLFK